MQIRKDHELQSLVPQTERVPVFDRQGVEIRIHDMPEELDSRSGSDDRNRGIGFNQFDYGAGMVRFGVVHDQVVDPGQGKLGLNIVFHLLPECKLGCLKQGIFFTAFQQVRVIGCTVFCLHDDVKDFELRVKDTRPVQVGFDSECLHTASPFIEQQR